MLCVNNVSPNEAVVLSFFEVEIVFCSKGLALIESEAGRLTPRPSTIQEKKEKKTKKRKMVMNEIALAF